MRTSTLLTAALVLLAASACSKRPSGDTRPPEGGALLPRPILKPDFVLTDQDGQPFDFRKDTEGYATLLFFGYTHCPDVCPVQMSNIATVLQRIPPEDARRIKVVFVTTDPARDDPARLKAWLGALNPSFIGLRGPIDSINAITQSMGFPGSFIEDTTQKDYTVGHMAVVFAFTRDDSAHAIYPFGTRQADWARDLPRLVHAYAPAGAD
jgi:protein SCO1/2